LDPDPLDGMLAQPSRQARVALGRVIDLPSGRRPCKRHVEFVFAGIDPGADDVRLAHLRPFLVMRTLKVPSTIRVRRRADRDLATKVSPQRLRWATIRRSAAWPRWPPGPGHSSRNVPSLMSRAHTRVGKGPVHGLQYQAQASRALAPRAAFSLAATCGQAEWWAKACIAVPESKWRSSAFGNPTAAALRPFHHRRQGREDRPDI